MHFQSIAGTPKHENAEIQWKIDNPKTIRHKNVKIGLGISGQTSLAPYTPESPVSGQAS